MKRSKSMLEKLTPDQIEEITSAAEKRKNVPLIKSQQVNMRMDREHLSKAKLLAEAQGVPYTTFLTQLLSEDLDRLWAVYRKTANKGNAT